MKIKPSFPSEENPTTAVSQKAEKVWEAIRQAADRYQQKHSA
ncbi:MAG: hypothetical protein AAFQ98_22860 [Bacteroidota bacterium]